MTSASDIMRLRCRLGASGVDSKVYEEDGIYRPLLFKTLTIPLLV